jgi:hypothetical protein
VIVVDGAESASRYPWIRGDPVIRADGRRVAYLAVAPDERFADAGMVPRTPADASAGMRLVFHPAQFRGGPLSPGQRPAPVKLLVVEEDVLVD